MPRLKRLSPSQNYNRKRRKQNDLRQVNRRLNLEKIPSSYVQITVSRNNTKSSITENAKPYSPSKTAVEIYKKCTKEGTSADIRAQNMAPALMRQPVGSNLAVLRRTGLFRNCTAPFQVLSIVSKLKHPLSGPPGQYLYGVVFPNSWTPYHLAGGVLQAEADDPLSYGYEAIRRKLTSGESASRQGMRAEVHRVMELATALARVTRSARATIAASLARGEEEEEAVATNISLVKLKNVTVLNRLVNAAEAYKFIVDYVIDRGVDEHGVHWLLVAWKPGLLCCRMIADFSRHYQVYLEEKGRKGVSNRK